MSQSLESRTPNVSLESHVLVTSGSNMPKWAVFNAFIQPGTLTATASLLSSVFTPNSYLDVTYLPLYGLHSSKSLLVPKDVFAVLNPFSSIPPCSQ